VNEGRTLLVVATVPLTVRAFLLPHLEAWRAAGWEPEVVAGEEDEVVAHAVPMTRRAASLANLLAPMRLAALYRRRRPGAVLATTPVAAACARLAALVAPVPRLLYLAQGLHFTRPLGLAQAPFLVAERLLAPLADDLVAVAEEDFQEVSRWGPPLRPGRTWRLLGIGVPPVEFQPWQPPTGRPPRIGYLGELNENKRAGLLVEASARLGIAHEVRLAGRGPLQPRLAEAARRLGAPVCFDGWVSDPVAWLRSVDLLVLPSRREGLPRCVLEAMAAGVPVVATENRGTRELLRGGCGRLVDADPGAIARAIEAALADHAGTRAMVERARERVAAYGQAEAVATLARLLGPPPGLAEARAAG
jgi:glycosyltransferase involved in cell wall biosynthesis